MKKQNKPSLYVVRINAVLRYFANNPKAREIALNKPTEYFAENDTDTIIEEIEGEVSDERAD